MAGRKDVGILAMDIYFPPTCVQQVKFFSPPGPGCACYRFPSLRAGRVDAVVPPIRGSDAFPHCGVGGFVMKDSGFFRNPRGVFTL